MSELIININLDNAAFCDSYGEEVSRILRNYCKTIEQNPQSLGELNDKYSFKDFNGNSVGEAKVVEYQEQQAEEKPKVLITLDSGLVQSVNSNIDLSVAILDFDIQEIGEVQADVDGEPMNAKIYETEFNVSKEIVDYYFNQLDSE